MITKLILFCTLLAPMVYSGYYFQSFVYPKMLIVEGFISILCAIYILKVGIKKFQIPQLIMFFYLVLTFVSCLLADDVYISISGSYERCLGFVQLFVLFIASVIISNNSTKDKMCDYLQAIGILGLFMAIFTAIQYFGLDPYQWIKRDHGPPTTTGNSNLTGMFLAISLIPSFSLIRKHKAFLFIPIVILTGVYLSESRGAMFAAVCGLLFMVSTLHKKLKYLFPVVAIITLLVLGQMNTYKTNPRSFLHKETITIINKFPFFGTGLENFRRNHSLVKTREHEKRAPSIYYDSAHNIFLHNIATRGFFAFIMWIFAFVVAMSRGMREGGDKILVCGALVAYFGAGMTSFDSVATNATIWALFGLLCSRNRQNKIEFYKPGIK